MKNCFQKLLAFTFLAIALSLVSAPAYAVAVKLGRTSETGAGYQKHIESPDSVRKSKAECVRDADCKTGYKCNPANNKCWDACNTMTFNTGQTCSEGVVTNCARGTTCRCTSPQVADGNGNCFNPCSPNPCSGSTPTCVQSAANYSCKCTPTSCPNAQACNGTSCYTCCTPVANGYCSGCDLRCNNGYKIQGSSCVLDCIPPQNGYCTSTGQILCNTGYVLSGTYCVPNGVTSGSCWYPYSPGPMGQLCGRDRSGRLCLSGGADKVCYWGYCARASDGNSYRATDANGEYTQPPNLPPGVYCLDEDCCVGV